MKISLKKTLSVLFLSTIVANMYAGIAFGQQTKLGTELEAYITEIEGKEYWYGVNIDSKHVGYYSEKVYRENSGDQKYIVYEIAAVDAQNDIDGERRIFKSTDSIFFDASSGLPVKCVFEKSDLDGSGRTIKLATRDGDKWLIDETGKDQQTRKLPSSKFDLKSLFSINIRGRSVDKVGEIVSGSEFDCESLNLVDITLGFLKTENKTIRGTKAAINVFSYKLVSEADNIDAVGKAMILKDGRLLSAKLGKISFSLQPKELLVGMPMTGIDTALNPSIQNHIENYSLLKSLRVEVQGSGLISSNVNSYRQKLVKESSESLVFELGGTGAEPTIASEIEIKNFLKSKQNSEGAAKEISKILSKLGIGEKTDAEKLWAILAFVSVYLEDNYFSPSSNVLEILNNKKGDCTEHSTLFVALARAAGLPARRVTGFIYNNEEENPGFAGHEWSEVVLNGVWIGIDPTWGEMGTSPIHVRLGSIGEVLRVSKINVMETRYIDEIPKREIKTAESAFEKEDYAAARNLFQKFSRKNDPVSNYYLGAIFELGLGVEKDLVKAIHYYRRSASRGDVDAMSSLADMYGEKDGAQNEPVTSAFWRQNAANKGSPKDALKLAQLYEDGGGVQKSSRLAYQWYKYAAEIAVGALEQ
jgi:hypothetical protein